MTEMTVEWREFQQNWKVLLGCIIGTITSAAVMPLYTLGPFVTPLAEEFGWTRGDVQASMSLFFVGLMIGAPVAGWMIARFGPRGSAVLSALGLSLGHFSLANLQQPIWHLYAVYALFPVIGAGTQHVTWTQVTGAWFVRNRGLALALVLTGTGLCALIVTPLVAKAITIGGWRLAMGFLACIPIVVTIPAVLILLPSKNAMPASDVARSAGDIQPDGVVVPVPRLLLSQMVRDRKFWCITIGLSLTVVGIVGLITNTVPLLHDKGIALTTAANIFSAVGVALICGRMVAGYLIDRLWAPGIAFISLIMPAFGALILALEADTIWIFTVAAILIGLGAGAEMDFASFLIARYFGLQNYSRTFSAFSACVALFTCAAPLIYGRLLDATGSYDAMLWICGAVFIVGPSLLLTLGPYPDN